MLDCETNEFGGSAYAKLLANDRGGIGDGLVGSVDQPGDLGQALAAAEQPQDLHLARGQSLSEIAWLVHASYKTVANTSSIMRQKLGVRTPAELVRLAIEHGVA